MSTTLAPALPITAVQIRSLDNIWPDLLGLCLFSLLGLTVSAAILSWVSSETATMMFVSIG